MDNNKFTHIFTAGTYNGVTITRDDLQQVVNSYNVIFHEAPVWLGHPGPADTGRNEPPALGWISALRLENDKLFAQLSDISYDLKYLIENNYMKYCSAEFVYYTINNVDTLYLFALGLTNRAAVTSLAPLSIDDSQQHTFNSNFKNLTTFTLDMNEINQNKKIYTMNEFLSKIAEAISLDISSFTSDSEVTGAITDAFLKQQSELKEANDAFNQLTEANSLMQAKRAEELIQFAIEAKKITPAEKEYLLKFANLDYDSAKSLIDSMPVSVLFAKDKVKDKSIDTDLSNPKFVTQDGKKVTYEMCLKDSALRAQFTAEELAELKQNSTFKK